MPQTEPRRQCQAKVSWGTTWEAGRRQCNNAAKDGNTLCYIHDKKARAREAAN